jgi:hypothetical protein
MHDSLISDTLLLLHPNSGILIMYIMRLAI